MTTLSSVGKMEIVYIDDLVRPISPLRDLRAFWKIYRVLRGWQPDIVHTHMAKAGTLGRLAALLYNHTRGRRRRARLIHTYHGHVFEGYFKSPSTRLFLLIERWLAKRTDAVIAISLQVKKDLLETYGVAPRKKVRLIPLGFNFDRLLALSTSNRKQARDDLQIPDDAIVVATVGRLTAIKQHSLFLEMASRLAQHSKRFVFLIVGDGELRRALEIQVKELGIAEHTQFLGWRGDLERIYGATDIFVLTSRNEGTPVALIEAMAAGVASVSTDVGGVRDVITSPELGSVVPFGDAGALEEAVASLADAPDQRTEIGRRARASVAERFHARRLLEDIKSLYWQLLEIGGTIP